MDNNTLWFIGACAFVSPILIAILADTIQSIRMRNKLIEIAYREVALKEREFELTQKVNI